MAKVSTVRPTGVSDKARLLTGSIRGIRESDVENMAVASGYAIMALRLAKMTDSSDQDTKT